MWRDWVRVEGCIRPRMSRTIAGYAGGMCQPHGAIYGDAWVIRYSLLVTIVSLLSPTVADSQSQRDALNAIYASTNGPGWNNSFGWARNSSFCDGWHGLKCDPDGNVMFL